MRTSQKIALTFLIALLLTSVFVVLAYTGLFSLLESDFLRERVIKDQQARLEVIAEKVSSWNSDHRARFEAMSGTRAFQGVFSTVSREEDILERERVNDSLKDSLIGYRGIRIVDSENRIQFSSFAGDIAGEQPVTTGSTGQRTYRNWDSGNPDYFELPGLSGTPRSFLVFSGKSNQILHVIPQQDSVFITRGWLIVYLGTSGLGEILAADGLIGPDGFVQVVEGRGLIVDIRPEQLERVTASIDQKSAAEGEGIDPEPVTNGIDLIWPVGGAPAEFAALADGSDERYFLAGTVSGDGTWVGKIVPGRLLGFTAAVQALIIATVFVSFSLLLFLLLNARQDRTEIIRSRVKKLQVSLLQDWLEHHEHRRLSSEDLERRREEVRNQLKAGLGSLGRHQTSDADKVIDEGWDRIIEILVEGDSKSPETDTPAAREIESKQPFIDMKQLEEMITRAVAEARVIVPPEALAGLRAAEFPPVARVPESPLRLAVEEDAVEELDDYGEPAEAEELEELNDFGEPAVAEELEELDEIGEPAEAEELEELDEIGEVGEPAESEELEELDEIGEPAEAEELEELDEIGEPAEAEEPFDDMVTIEPVEIAEREYMEELDRPTADNGEEQAVDADLEQFEEETEENLEVLPIVLSEDSTELIEIGRIDQDRMYMFDKDKPKTGENETGQDDYEELTELEEVGTEAETDDLEDLEDLPEMEEIREPVRESGGKTGVEAGTASRVMFFDVDEVIRHRKSVEEDISTFVEKKSDEEPAESMILVRTSGILPGGDRSEESFGFEDDIPQLSWSPDGLEFDRYLKGFKKGTMGILKSLMTLSKEYSALSSVLLVGSRKGLESEFFIGLNDESATRLSVTRNEPVWSEWFSKRSLIMVPDLSRSLYAEKTRHDDFRKNRSALFIPVVYHGSQSYLFLGFKDPPHHAIYELTGLEAVK